MDESEEKHRNIRSRPLEGLNSPFLEEELFTGEGEEDLEARLPALEAETPFALGLEQGAGLVDTLEVEEAEESSSEVETPYVDEEMEDYEEEEVEEFEWEDEEAQDEFEWTYGGYEDEEQENFEEEFDTFEDESFEEEEAEPYEFEDSIVFSYEEEVESDFEEPLPLLFDAERPEAEEEVDEEAELPTDPADGWVTPGDVRRAGEAQYVKYDDAPPWDASGRNCTGKLSDGAQIIRSYLMENFSGINRIGGYNCRPNSASPHKVSIHGTGRALDIMIPTLDGQANSAVGDPISNWLVLNAAATGIQYLIWNRVRWSGGAAEAQIRPVHRPQSTPRSYPC